MPKTMKLFFSILIVSIFLVPLIYADETSSYLGTIKQNSCIEIPQVCASCSYIYLNIQYPNKTMAETNKVMNYKGSGLWTYYFCNTSELGRYDVTGIGDVDGIVSNFVMWFEVTPNGEEVNVGKAIFYIGLFGVLIVFLGLSLVGFVKFDHLLAKVGLFGLSYLLLMAITFVGWNMASDFLTSAPFIASMLRILFFVLIVGFFPLILGSFAYYLIMITKIKEIERLMEKGIPYDEAERRVKRR